MHTEVYVEQSSQILIYQPPYFMCCIDPCVIAILTLHKIDLLALIFFSRNKNKQEKKICINLCLS